MTDRETLREVLTSQDEAIVRRSWNEPRSWPVPQLLAEIDRLRAALATPAPVALDAAWAAAEAALPEGWRRVSLMPVDDPKWNAVGWDNWMASTCSADFFEGETDADSHMEVGYGPTPAAALHALVVALPWEPPDPDETVTERCRRNERKRRASAEFQRLRNERCARCGHVRNHVTHETDRANAPEGLDYYADVPFCEFQGSQP